MTEAPEAQTEETGVATPPQCEYVNKKSMGRCKRNAGFVILHGSESATDACPHHLGFMIPSNGTVTIEHIEYPPVPDGA